MAQAAACLKNNYAQRRYSHSYKHRGSFCTLCSIFRKLHCNLKFANAHFLQIDEYVECEDEKQGSK